MFTNRILWLFNSKVLAIALEGSVWLGITALILQFLLYATPDLDGGRRMVLTD